MTVPSVEFLAPRRRFVLIAGLLIVLCGLLVWAGVSLEPDPADNSYPGSDDIGPNPEAYVGERVSLGGVVISEEPLRIEASHPGGSVIVRVTGVDDAPPLGDELIVFGTLTEPDVVRAQRAVSREPWERHYMYAVSFLGGLWVLSRLFRHWRPDRTSLSVVPRGERDA